MSTTTDTRVGGEGGTDEPAEVPGTLSGRRLAPSARLVDAASGFLARRISRRGVLARFALVGSALAFSGTSFALRPGTAYASICGSGSSCSSGWTAMCCTVNEGVNQCPPGTFAGGWWKATGASLCGGRPRYIVDCQAKCKCGCGGGNHCAKRCWSCKPHCAKGGCDNRRVCWNVFRYGQCDRHVRCSGPVMCRAVSCTPPWKWANCSTAAATDNRTRNHSSQCLPKWSPIQARYTRMGSQASVLGATVGRERKGRKRNGKRRGRMQRFTRGRMYRSRRTGAHHLRGKVLRKYRELGEAASPLGLPVTSSKKKRARGRGAKFQRGGVFGARGRKAHALWGPVWKAWQRTGQQRGPLGYPITDRRVADDGRGLYALFENGGIFKAPGRKARPVHGPHARKYRALRHERGPLGYPLSGQRERRDGVGRAGVVQRFQHGRITTAPGGRVHAVWGAVHDRWRTEGGEGGPLGFPVSDLSVRGGVEQCDFTGGRVTHDRRTGRTTVVLR